MSEELNDNLAIGSISGNPRHKFDDLEEGERYSIAINQSKKAKPTPKNTLTVVENVYHQVVGEQPTMTESRFTRDLESTEQVFTRHLVLTEEWKPLEVGWLDQLSMMVIKNNEGIGLKQIPTKEQREEIDQRVIEVSYTPNSFKFMGWTIFPRESMRACPSDARLLHLRCRTGTARATITLLPS